MSEKWDVSEEEFRAKLEEYTAEDYLKGTPHQYLANLMQMDYDRYVLYSHMLADDAMVKGISDEEYQRVSGPVMIRIKNIRAIHELINSVLADRIPEEKVGILPIMCGNGKSSAVSQKILEVINANDGRGLIVVTDSVDRLNEYVRPTHNEILSAYFEEHYEQITTMYADTLLEASFRQYASPVLLMTTQRYFSLSPEEIRAYTKWAGGVRDTIMIDERPPLREIVHVKQGDIHTVTSAILDGISDTADQDEKMWCVQQWHKVESRFECVCHDFEHRYPEKQRSYFFYTNPSKCVTEDDERFMRFIAANESAFKRYHEGKSYKILKAVFIIEQEGAVFQSQKGKYYSNTFSVLIDHREMITNVGAKVLILDGTADLHPDYQQDYLHCPELMEHERELLFHNLESLTLQFIDFPTSKSKLEMGDRQHEIKDGILSYLDGIQRQQWGSISNGGMMVVEDQTPHDPKQWPIFTYKKLEDHFRRKGYVNLEHFGNIKGRNDFKDHNKLVQIGLNRFDPLYYLTYGLYTTTSLIETFRSLPEENCSQQIEEIMKDPTCLEKIVYAMILEDIEQNFFRGAIRKGEWELYHDRIGMMYWIFCDTKVNEPLIVQAKERYENMGAAVHVVNNPPQKMHAKAMARKGKKPTAYQAVCRWLQNAEKGREFRREHILKETGITVKAFEELMRKDESIQKRFAEMVVEGKKRVYRIR